MATRWVVCPLVTVCREEEDGDPAEFRTPKVGMIVEPGRGKPYQFTALVGGERALALVRGEDWSALEADHDIIDIFGADAERVRGRRLGEIARGADAVRLIARLNALGVAGLTPQTTAREVLERLAGRLGVPGDIDRMHV